MIYMSNPTKFKDYFKDSKFYTLTDKERKELVYLLTEIQLKMKEAKKYGYDLSIQVDCIS